MTESHVYSKTWQCEMVVFHWMKFSTKDDFREGILKDIDLFGYISLKNPNFGYIFQESHFSKFFKYRKVCL